MSLATDSRDQDRVSSLDELDVIIDADGHTLEGLDDVIPYVENRAVQRLLQRSERPLADVFTFTHTGPIIGEAYNRGGEDITHNTSGDEVEKKNQDLEDFGIDYSITTPTLHLMINTVNNDRTAVELAKAYNSWAMDNLVDKSEKFKLAMVAAAQKPNKAAEEIDRLGGEDDVVGVYVPPGMWTPLGNEYYDPIYRAARDHDLTILVHAQQMREAGFPVQAHGAQTFAETHNVSLPWSVMWAMTSLMFEGVPERFPGLDFVFSEGGVAWLPWMKWRMDDQYMEFRDELPWLDKLPSKYIDEGFYLGTQPIELTAADPTALPKIIDLAGPENLLYSADLPHIDFDPPEELFDRIHQYLDADAVRGIMGENSAEVFGIDY